MPFTLLPASIPLQPYPFFYFMTPVAQPPFPAVHTKSTRSGNPLARTACSPIYPPQTSHLSLFVCPCEEIFSLSEGFFSVDLVEGLRRYCSLWGRLWDGWFTTFPPFQPPLFGFLRIPAFPFFLMSSMHTQPASRYKRFLTHFPGPNACCLPSEEPSSPISPPSFHRQNDGIPLFSPNMTTRNAESRNSPPSRFSLSFCYHSVSFTLF